MILERAIRLLARLFYRVRVEGLAHVPSRGPALLVANHVSFVDAVLLSLPFKRRVRFLMSRTYYNLPVANLLFRAFDCIPVSESDGPKALLASFRRAREALEAGSLVCIFAEGEISRHGQMLRFKKGFEHILEGLAVPIIPVHLDQLWGSIFSFEGGRVLLKRPRRIPYPVTVSFGAPLPAATAAPDVRRQIVELGAAAFRHRLSEKPPLALAYLREARRHPLRLAVADSTGAQWSCASLLARAFLLGRTLPEERFVGVLLPPSAAAAAVNLGLMMQGRVPVNLNYTASKEVVDACVAKAGIKNVVSSRRFLEKLGWRPQAPALALEELAAGISKPTALFWTAVVLVWPERLLLPRARVGLDELATVLFTSGSTGDPKGVMLSHANILSNVEAVSQVYHLGPQDRLLGVLPFFHALGLTGTLFMPLLSGMGVVYHTNPLEAQKVGELAARWRTTFLLATPTFLQGYLRRVPKESFQTLRIVVVGAEKLREELARAFEEKFGLWPLEGYGATELSPVAAVNIPDLVWPGIRQKGRKAGSVGHALPGVFIKAVDPESGEEGAAGLLLVRGPNVMKGYLGDEKATREAFRGEYYVTGDIGTIDTDGFITLTDRISRFSKVGGEMVPHLRLEEKLHELAGTSEQTFVVSAAPDAKRGERLVVFHKSYNDVDGLWRKLKSADWPRLWLPDREDFRAVAEFPLLGSGKLDLRALKAEALKLAR